MKKIHNFTLVELLVTMGVFCILLMVSMQIFGNAGKLWTRSEQKNGVYAAARTAMEFISARIQSHAYTEDMPFEISSTSGSTQYERIFFPTAMPMNRKDNDGKDRDKYSLRFIGFDLDQNTGVLKMNIYSDEGKTSFLNLMPPYSAKRRGRSGGGNIPRPTTADAARSWVRNAIFPSGSSPDAYNSVEIVENVVNFRMLCYDLPQDPTSPQLILRDARPSADGVLTTPPYMMIIELQMLESKDQYRKWRAASSDERTEIKNEFGHTFHRALLLGDRRKLKYD